MFSSFVIFYLFIAIQMYLVYIIKMTRPQIRLCLLVLQAIVVSRKHEIRERPCFTVTSEGKWRRAEEVVYCKVLIFFLPDRNILVYFKKKNRITFSHIICFKNIFFV